MQVTGAGYILEQVDQQGTGVSTAVYMHHIVGAAQLEQRLALWVVGMALAQEPPQTRLPFPQGISTLSPTQREGEQGDIPLSGQLRLPRYVDIQTTDGVLLTHPSLRLQPSDVGSTVAVSLGHLSRLRCHLLPSVVWKDTHRDEAFPGVTLAAARQGKGTL